MKVVATIQVRMGSSRLPGKVMKEIQGKPVLGLMIDRVKRSKLIDDVVVATSVNKENQVIADYCEEIGVHCFRGSEDDVLDRMLGALKSLNADIGVEIYGDCPFADPTIIDHIVGYYLNNQEEFDFVSNDLKTTYPPGVEVEVFSVKVLEDSSNMTNDPSIREHGTLYIRQNPDRYRLYNVEAPKEMYYPEMEIEMDTQEDFNVVKRIFDKLYPLNESFTTKDVIEFLLKNPEVMEENKNIPRRWKKYRES